MNPVGHSLKQQSTIQLYPIVVCACFGGLATKQVTDFIPVVAVKLESR